MVDEEIKKAIDDANRKFSEGFLKGDASITLSGYVEDSILFPPDADFVLGKEAIEKFWRGVMSSGVREANLTTLDLLGDDECVQERGTGLLKIQSKDGNIAEQKIKYVVVWRRIANDWRNLWDIWNKIP